MKYILTILLISAAIGIGVGFYIKPDNHETGQLIIGLSVVLLFFIVMPVFIYHRWKNKNVKDYMLTKENIDKMKKYGQDKKL